MVVKAVGKQAVFPWFKQVVLCFSRCQNLAVVNIFLPMLYLGKEIVGLCCGAALMLWALHTSGLLFWCLVRVVGCWSVLKALVLGSSSMHCGVVVGVDLKAGKSLFCKGTIRIQA